MESKQKCEPTKGIAQVVSNDESPIAQETLKGKNRRVKLEQVWQWDNLLEADRLARKGKGNKYGVRKFDRNWWENMTQIQQSLVDETYHTEPPTLEERYCEHKTRILAKLHYYDHVVHHALMNICEPVFDKAYYYESAASIKGRGIHYAMKHVRRFIDLNRDEHQLYWSQLDFVKCYHHVKRAKVYDKICRTFHDKGIRRLFHDIIYAMGNHNGLCESDGTEGMGIGFYPVQPLVNFYLSDMDRAVAALPDVKVYRYCDNILLIGYSREAVWNAIGFIKNYAQNTLEQPLHESVGVQRLCQQHPIDFVGYKFYPDHTLIRTRTKTQFKCKCRHIKSEPERSQMLASYNGWLSHCNGLHLWQTTTGMKQFSELGIQRTDTMHNGERYFEVPTVSASFLVNRQIIVKDFIEQVTTRNGNGRMCILVEENGTDKKFLTNNPRLKDIMLQVRKLDELPFQAMLRSRNINGGKIEYYFE